MTRLAVHQTEGKPASRLYQVVHRVADRLEPELRAAFLEAIERELERVSREEIVTALRRQDTRATMRALRMDRMTQALGREMDAPMRQTMLGAGEAVAEELARSLDATFAFDATDPNAIMAARREAATMVARISDETRLAVRSTISDMFVSGVPPEDAARRIRKVVGLRRDHARAVRNFRKDLRTIREMGAGEADDLIAETTDRRLDAATKQKIRKLGREGKLTDEAIEGFTETYRKSLLNRRAQDIARTESIRAANAGQQQTWRQAADQGAISRDNARRVWIVTPDARLRASHAAIPGLNAQGVRLEEPFEMPDGSTAMYPPPAFDPVNCRCSTSLMFGDTGTII